MDCIAHEVAKSQTRLSDFHFTSLHVVLEEVVEHQGDKVFCFRSVSQWQNWDQNSILLPVYQHSFSQGWDKQLYRVVLPIQTYKVTVNVTVHISDVVSGCSCYSLALSARSSLQTSQPILITCRVSHTEENNSSFFQPHALPKLEEFMSELMKMPLKINCSIVRSWFSKRHYLHELCSKPWIPRSTSLPVQNSFFPLCAKEKRNKREEKKFSG